MIANDTIPQDKKAARAWAMARRAGIHAAAGEGASLKLLAVPFPVAPVAGHSVVSAFHPFGAEIDARPLMGKLAGEGWTTALPVVIRKGQPLTFRRWLPGQPMEKGAMNIDQPQASAPVVEPDVLLVPLLVFDRHGYRLGYGGGFYDRTLEMLRTKKKVTAIGLGYARQEVPAVPREAHDAKLDYVLTEKGIITCG